VIGLVPTSPVIAEAGTFVIPVFDKITKWPAVPRNRGVGPGEAANPLPANAKNATAIFPTTVKVFVIMQAGRAIVRPTALVR
jgi:hypothetical protein